MAVTTIETLSHAMKYIYLDPLIKTIDEGSGPILAAIDKGASPVEGDKFVFAAQYGRNGGIGARGESDDLPDASPRNVRRGLGNQRNIYARISFTEKFMHQVSHGNRASFIEGVTAQMDDLATDAKDYMRRNIMTDHTGMMAKTTAGATGTDTIPMDADSVMHQFYEGQVVDFFTVNSPTNPTTQTKSVNGVRIKAVDRSAKKIILESSATVPPNSYVSIHNAFLNELTGLREIMTADTEIYSINRADNKWFNPQVYNKGGTAAFNSMFMQEAIDDIFDTMGEKPDFIAMNSAMRRQYIKEQQAYKRNIEPKKFDGGFSMITYDGIAITPEKYMKDGEIYILSTKDFKLAQLADWSWMDHDGSIFNRVPNKAAYEATLTKYAELLCKKPASQAVITGIKVN